MKLIKNFFALILLFTMGLSACEDDGDNNGSPSNDNNDNKEINKKGTGESAEALLNGDPYSKILVEIQYMEGYQPTDEALDSLRSFLKRYLNKPDGITFQKNAIAQVQQNQFTADDIRNIEDSSRSVYTKDDQIGLYFLFLNGAFEQNNGVVGLAYWNTSMAIFEEKIQEISGGTLEPDQSTVEAAVINHEIGHNLGLVDNGTPMQENHIDDGNGKHCDVEDCLMYYSIETEEVVDNILDNNFPTLDDQCRDDLKANGGK